MKKVTNEKDDDLGQDDYGSVRSSNPYAGNPYAGANNGKPYAEDGSMPPDPRQYSPRLEENNSVRELGGDSDLLYNDPSLDPASGSIISADQLDRLMLRGLKGGVEDDW